MECVFTQNLDSYLGDLVPQAKPVDNPIKKSQDLILDITGPLAMVWEHMNSPETLSVDVIQTCISKALFFTRKCLQPHDYLAPDACSG